MQTYAFAMRHLRTELHTHYPRILVLAERLHAMNQCAASENLVDRYRAIVARIARHENDGDFEKVQGPGGMRAISVDDLDIGDAALAIQPVYELNNLLATLVGAERLTAEARGLDRDGSQRPVFDALRNKSSVELVSRSVLRQTGFSSSSRRVGMDADYQRALSDFFQARVAARFAVANFVKFEREGTTVIRKCGV